MTFEDGFDILECLRRLGADAPWRERIRVGNGSELSGYEDEVACANGV